MFHWCTGQGSMHITHDTPSRGLEGQVSAYSCAYTHKRGIRMRVHALAGLSSSMRTASHSCIRPFIRLSGSPWILFVVGRCGRGCALRHSNRAPYYVFSSFREGAVSKLRNYGWRFREKFDIKKKKRWRRWEKSMVNGFEVFLNYCHITRYVNT